ncbi:MAG: single-stranded DNA-binding protein [Candidatus Liptonbacteria bacterium]
MNLNKVFIIGRVTADPQLRNTPAGASVTTFGVATNRVWQGKNGQKQEEAEFHSVVAWGRQAEIASQFLVKGALVYVEGRLRTRTWQDKQGQNHKVTETICERLQLGPRAGGGAAPMGNPAAASAKENKAEDVQSAPPEEIPIIDLEDDIKPEDLPF